MQPGTEQHALTSTTGQQRSISKEEIIKTYLEKELPEGKSTFCRFYRQGCCLFSAKECKHAHDISDLKFKRLDIKDTKKLSKPQGEEDQDDEDEKKEEREVVRKLNQHKNIYDSQFVLKERGEIDRIYTLEEIDNTRSVRQAIRDIFYRDLQHSFMDFLFREYNTMALKKSFIEKCFLSVDWVARWKHIHNKKYFYEVKSPNEGIVIVKKLQGEEYDMYMEKCVIKIIKDHQLLQKVPISPSLITKLYYQYLGPLDPYMPSHQIYLKYRNFESFDDYLDKLQNTERFRKKLVEAYGMEVQEKELINIFEHSSNEMKELMNQARKILLEMVEKSSIGCILYSSCEEKVMKKCAKRLQLFNGNIPQIKKSIMKMVLQENILVINLASAMYLFSIDKFKRVNLNEIRGKYYKKLFSGCSLPASDHIALHQLPTLRLEKMDIPVPGRKTEEFLQKEIDLSKVTIVDSKENLKKAMEHFANINAIGVDLEGALHKHGRLELVQCSSRTHIFIFDIYQTKKLAKTDQSYSGLYNELSLFLRNLIEDSRICKIFHDGRKDSEALHVFLDACPSNVFDLSAVFMLIEHLEAYKAQKVKSGECKEGKNDSSKGEEEQKKDERTSIRNWDFIGEVKLPGLNDVLEKYQATHGPNKLKEAMKSRFGVVPREYFLQRPIDKEFLIYSARDVEDLIEIKGKMEQKLREILMFFTIDHLEEDKVDLLCKKISKSYAIQGCKVKD